MTAQEIKDFIESRAMPMEAAGMWQIAFQLAEIKEIMLSVRSDGKYTLDVRREPM